MARKAKQSKAQKATVERVMHEFKDGELTQNNGRTVKDRKQAVAIALSEAGASRKDARGKAKTNAKSERASTQRKAKTDPARPSRAKRASSLTRDGLYRQAAKAGIPGRSPMSKQELARALSR